MTGLEKQSPRFLTLKQIADELGVTRRTVNRYIQDGRLPVVRLSSNCTRIDRADLEKFLRVRRT